MDSMLGNLKIRNQMQLPWPLLTPGDCNLNLWGIKTAWDLTFGRWYWGRPPDLGAGWAFTGTWREFQPWPNFLRGDRANPLDPSSIISATSRLVLLVIGSTFWRRLLLQFTYPTLQYQYQGRAVTMPSCSKTSKNWPLNRWRWLQDSWQPEIQAWSPRIVPSDASQRLFHRMHLFSGCIASFVWPCFPNEFYTTSATPGISIIGKLL